MVSSSYGRCQIPASVLLGPPELHLVFSASLLSAKGLATPSTAVCHSWLGLLHQQPDPRCVLWVREREAAQPGLPASGSPHRALGALSSDSTVAAQPAAGTPAHAPVWPAGAPVCLPQVPETPLQKRLRWNRPKQKTFLS